MTNEEMLAFRARMLDAADTFDRVMGNNVAWLILAAPNGDADRSLMLTNLTGRSDAAHMMFSAIAGMADGHAEVVAKPQSTTQ